MRLLGVPSGDLVDCCRGVGDVVCCLDDVGEVIFSPWPMDICTP